MEKQEIAIHQLTESTRITARYDTMTYAIEDIIGDECGVVSLEIARNLMPIKQDLWATGLADDILRLTDNFIYKDSELRERAITRYLNLKDCDSLIVNLQGYSQSEWARVVIFNTRGSDQKLTDIKNALDEWFKGDIYSIHSQVLETYTNDTDPSDKIYDWQTRDSLYCNLATDKGIESDLAGYETFLSWD
jgi:hypothetical protein